MVKHESDRSGLVAKLLQTVQLRASKIDICSVQKFLRLTVHLSGSRMPRSFIIYKIIRIQPTFTCSKSTIETPEQCGKYV